MKRTLVYIMTAKARRQNVAFLDLSWEVCAGWLKFLIALLLSVSEHESPVSIDFEATNIL